MTAAGDHITQLVDQALATPIGKRSGYDNNINQDKCPHHDCWREWHGLPSGRCPGSPNHGPHRPPPTDDFDNYPDSVWEGFNNLSIEWPERL